MILPYYPLSDNIQLKISLGRSYILAISRHKKAASVICPPNTGHPVLGYFMRYSYEYKKKCVELYRQVKWPETPDEVNKKTIS